MLILKSSVSTYRAEDATFCVWCYLDDWDIGFQSDKKLHRTPTTADIKDGYDKDELIDDYDLPAHWLMMQMNNFCVGANYVFLNGKHYYTVHHS